MKVVFLLLGAFGLSTGCASLRKDMYVLSTQFYPGSHNFIERSEKGFSVRCPESWVLYANEDGLSLGIHGYAYSPLLSFRRLKPEDTWQKHLNERDRKLARDTRIEASENLRSYNKFSGNGIRRGGFNTYFGEKYEFVLFCPDAELSGTSIEITFFGSPNELSLKELDAIIRSVAYSPRSSKNTPNQSPEPARGPRPAAAHL